MIRNLRDWAVKQKILADDLQGHTDRLRTLYPLTFSGNVLTLTSGKSGMHVHIPEQARITLGIIVAKIDSARTGGGLYKGFHVAAPTSPISTTADLDTGDIGDVGTKEITLVNLQEMNAGSTHWLTDSDNTDQLYCFALPWGIDDNGVSAYAICHIWVAPCTPTPTPTPPP